EYASIWDWPISNSSQGGPAPTAQGAYESSSWGQRPWQQQRQLEQQQQQQHQQQQQQQQSNASRNTEKGFESSRLDGGYEATQTDIDDYDTGSEKPALSDSFQQQQMATKGQPLQSFRLQKAVPVKQGTSCSQKLS